jgi:maltose alpha-D-glucosyltransferase/alpha-amylase
MVTDEERDYMYRVYAQEHGMRINLGIRRRLAPLLENDRRKIELMNALLFTLPGTPVIYYGDEIGMGDNIYLGDRNGVRTPMQWSSDRNAGFSRANPQKLYLPVIIDPQYHYEAINVEAQQNNPHSLLWWMKHLIEQRKQFKAFGRGTLEFLRPSNRKVLAFYRRYQEETILVIANLSRFPQHVELDLSSAKGMTPVEIFGRAQFPAIGDQPYTITLGALSFYWLSLETKNVRKESISEGEKPAVPEVSIGSLEEVFEGRTLAILLRMLPEFLRTRRWFHGKDRGIRTIELYDALPIADRFSQILLAEIEYIEGDPEFYVLPGSVAVGEEAKEVKEKLSEVTVLVARESNGQEGILYSAVWNPAFCENLLGAIARRRRFRGKFGEIVGSHTRVFRKVWGERHPYLAPTVLNVDQSNTCIAFGDRFMLKIYRRVEPGIHPEIELGNFLTDMQFPSVAPLTGTLEYRREISDPMSVAVLHGFVQNQGDAWRYTLDSLSQFFAAALARQESENVSAAASRHYLDVRLSELPQHAHELLGAYVDSAGLLGRRTAELHLALGSNDTDPAFTPEPVTDHYRQGVYHSMMSLTTQTSQLLRQRLPSLQPAAQAEVQRVLDQQDKIRKLFRPIAERKFSAMRIRVHDDLRLEQILYTGKDFIFIGLGGKANRPLGERRIKRSPLRDVANMLLSFRYAADSVFFDKVPGVTTRPEINAALEFWSGSWCDWVSSTFLKGYFEAIGASSLLPKNDVDVRALLDLFVLERSLEEITRELSERPDWARIPARMILRVLEVSPSQ